MAELALDQVYRQHGDVVRSFAQRLLADRASAEDVAQEVFVRMLVAPSRFDPERGSLRSYLMTQTCGRAMDHLRSESARARRQGRAAAGADWAGFDVEQDVCDADLAHRLRAALGALPDAERQAITMAYFGRMSYREVARLLAEPEGTVKSRIRAGLRRLNQSLGAPGPSSR